MDAHKEAHKEAHMEAHKDVGRCVPHGRHHPNFNSSWCWFTVLCGADAPRAKGGPGWSVQNSGRLTRDIRNEDITHADMRYTRYDSILLL